MVFSLKNFILFYLLADIMINAVPLQQEEEPRQKPATICTYTDWGVYREGKKKFDPDDIDATLCDYIVYVFALLDESLNKIIPGEPDADLNKGFYKKVTDLQNEDLSAVICLGGYVDSTDKYSKMMANETHRKNVAASIVNFLKEYNFRGIQIDIGFPGAYQGEIDEIYAQDKVNYVLFLREVKDQLEEAYRNKIFEYNPILAIGVSGRPSIVEVAYDVPAISELVDWITVLTLDISGNKPQTAVPSPFIAQPNDVEGDRNVRDMMEMWLTKGAPAGKLVLGFPFFGPMYQLVDENEHGLRAPTSDKKNGQFYSYLTFFEVVDKVRDEKWDVVHLPNLGSYAYRGSEWVGFDDAADVAVKANYILDKGFFGGMVWALDYDYFQEDSPIGRYPLLTTLNDIFSRKIEHTEVSNYVNQRE